MAASHLLLPVIFCSALFAASSSRHDRCLWRFDDCNLHENASQCVVRLRCANSSLEVNATRARALVSGVDERCNVSSCAVQPRQCQWTPWTLYFDTCMLKMRQRFRERCCHPVHRTPINTSLYPALDARCDRKRRRQQRSKINFFYNCSTPITFPPRRASPDDDDELNYPFLVSVAFLCLSLAGFGACFHRAKKSGRFRPPPTPADQQPPPTTVIVPQPGWPLSEVQPLTQ